MSKAIILVNFGTTSHKALELIEKIETTIRYKGELQYKVISVFTSNTIRQKLKMKGIYKYISLNEALFNLASDQYKEVIVQPMFLSTGNECENILKTALEYQYAFENIRVGSTLLGDEDSLEKVAKILENKFKDTGNILFLGHGWNHEGIYQFEKLINKINVNGSVFYICINSNYEEMIKKIRDSKPSNIIIVPLLFHYGYHVEKDVFGELGVANMLKGYGIEIQCYKKVLLEYPEIIEIFLGKIFEKK